MTVRIELEPDEALVLYDFLQREIDNEGGKRLKRLSDHDSELWALNALNCLLERALAEPFAKDYPALLSQARDSLLQRSAPWPD
jgi:hypothetical protein